MKGEREDRERKKERKVGYSSFSHIAKHSEKLLFHFCPAQSQASTHFHTCQDGFVSCLKHN